MDRTETNAHDNLSGISWYCYAELSNDNFADVVVSECNDEEEVVERAKDKLMRRGCEVKKLYIYEKYNKSEYSSGIFSSEDCENLGIDEPIRKPIEENIN